MGTMTRRRARRDPRAIARLRRWYAWTIAGRWSFRDLIGAWTLRVPPNVWNLGWPATEAEMSRYRGRYLIHADGTAWGPRRLALARAASAAEMAARYGRAPDAIGSPAFVFGPPISELVRCSLTFAAYRVAERQHLAPRVDDSADVDWTRLAGSMGVVSIRLPAAHVARRKDLSPKTGGRYQKGFEIPSLARSLVIWGLIEAGLAHRAAIRQWLAWEVALLGPVTKSARVRRASKLTAAGDERDVLREFEDSVRGADKQSWVALGIAR
jgi:hypothetical protein